MIMETDSKLKKKAVNKTSAKLRTKATDPFESVVGGTTKKKVVAKKKIVADTVEADVKPAKKTAIKAPKTFAADPFSEIIEPSSPVKKTAVKAAKADSKLSKKPIKQAKIQVAEEIIAKTPKAEVSPVFRALADVKLPELQRVNRARLQMQTPTRLYLYWSVKENPWALLKNVFGDDLVSYTLVVKLIDTKSEREEIKQCDAEGNWWFDVEPDGSYKAEIGFYAPNRPYFRILHSNTVETPRRSPSPRVASDSDWNVSANKFAEVLDVAGFSRDAFDVAMAGDDQVAAKNVSQKAFSSFLENREVNLTNISAEDIRYAMLAIASGATLEELRHRVSPAVFAILQANVEKLIASRAINALNEHFDIDETEFTEEQYGAAVYGASLVNFPRTLKTRVVTSKFLRRHNPVSSQSIWP